MSKANASTERIWLARLGFAQSHKFEKNTTYNGERPSALSFFTQFPEVIFRWNGSVLPNVAFEILLAIGVSITALYSFPEEAWSPVGHQIVGVLLAFLVVFRSNSAISQYTEGRTHTEALLAASRIIASETMTTLVVYANESKRASNGQEALEASFEEAVREAFEILRLLKLFYFSVVEHVRSTEGKEPWAFAQDVMSYYATPTEVQTLRAEFGFAQERGRVNVVPKAAGNPSEAQPAERYQQPRDSVQAGCLNDSRWSQNEFQLQLSGMVLDAKCLSSWAVHSRLPQNEDLGVVPGIVQTDSESLARERSFDGEKHWTYLQGKVAQRLRGDLEGELRETTAAKHRKSVLLPADVQRSVVADELPHRPVAGPHHHLASTSDIFTDEWHMPHDPTRAKPLLVHTWLRSAVGRLKIMVVKLAPMENAVIKNCEMLLQAKAGMDKIDNVVLPLPYCQLLKGFAIMWIYSLPFVLVNECGTFLPVIMALIACAFFGLDSVGAELEAPFGVDANDYPLLHWGIALAEDLDVMQRQTLRTCGHVLGRDKPARHENVAAEMPNPVGLPPGMSSSMRLDVINRMEA